MCKLPTLIKRCLTYGIQIYPYQLDGILSQYETKAIPDEILNKYQKEDLNKYVNGLYLCSCEMAGDWTIGHDILKELGFKEQKREDGHRIFISLVYENI